MLSNTVIPYVVWNQEDLLKKTRLHTNFSPDQSVNPHISNVICCCVGIDTYGLTVFDDLLSTIHMCIVL